MTKLLVMMVLLLCIVNKLCAYDKYDVLGVLKSSISREPQVIRLEEIKKDQIVFKFCDTIESDNCQMLGRQTGYSIAELENFSIQMRARAKVTMYGTPLMALVPYVAAYSVAATPGLGIGVLFLIFITSDQANKAIVSDKMLDSLMLKRVGKVLDPEALNYPMKLKESISIVEFSYFLEKILNAGEKSSFEKMLDMGRQHMIPEEYYNNET
ncbi:MAG: hypothetical protein A2381_11390 [Bdellovibrionales bacterium RIFOXYB1_FULL_37_110]|nr:MAG: hypothetical protein A2417_11695 [Bdellovibrionales bacterium RIFOXYC1_FULL_37_79]OFZ57296.1 MAG: hypothetical protein A2381_11390 [Bdellovibrionales bacterium RIFOXYB1_FULL_37_110]OFZ62192.1 MAG: hypothetical protein A2577_13940 [Bdellovibrionales bacterium RIFOXYD1_FULL_36_51]